MKLYPCELGLNRTRRRATGKIRRAIRWALLRCCGVFVERGSGHSSESMHIGGVAVSPLQAKHYLPSLEKWATRLVAGRFQIVAERGAAQLLLQRGHRVMLDADLAELYGVQTKALNQAIKRNEERFPDDFMFQLSREEAGSLRSQTVTLKAVRGKHWKYLPYVFTEHGAIMAASVLNSSRAIEASVYVVRAFVRMREAMSSDRELARRLDSLEKKYAAHDVRIRGIFDAIRELMEPPKIPRRRIGY